MPPGTRELVAERIGLDFPDRRAADLARGLARAARASGCRAVPDYVERLRALPAASDDWHRLAGELTIGESYFFRDRGTHDALMRHVLPPLIAERRAAGELRLRLWSAGCSRGEEAYSLAILVHRLLPDRERWQVTILGTDIDPQALAAARRGIYRPWALREIPDWIRPYFTCCGPDQFELAPEIRQMVTFAPLNLASDTYPASTAAVDVILCRNVLMYFTREAQRATVERLKRRLVDGGWLVVGPAEASPELLRPLAPVYLSGAILRRKATVSELPAPTAVRREPTHGTPDRTVTARRRSDTAPAPAPVELARAEADLGRLERATELCRAALEHDRLDAEAHLLLAAIKREQGDADAALSSARAAIYAAPDSAAAHFLLGSVLLQRGAAEQGRRSMETVANLLDAVPPNQPLSAAVGMTAGILLATVRAQLAVAT